MAAVDPAATGPPAAADARRSRQASPPPAPAALDPLAVRILGPQLARLAWVAGCVALAAWFAVQSYGRLSAFYRAGVPIGLDARIYFRGVQAWLEGADPWQATVQIQTQTFHYFGSPVTTVLLAPATLLGEDLFTLAWVALSALAGIWIVRRLRLPAWWLLFPPLTEGIYGANPQLVVLALLLAGGGIAAAVATGLKVYAFIPLLGERRWRDMAAGVVFSAATILIAPNLWLDYLRSFSHISDQLRIDTYMGHSGYYFPALLITAAVALLLLAMRDLRRAGWLTVPAIWPGTEFHYSTFAMPVMTPILAALLAVPILRMPPIAITLAIAWYFARGRVRMLLDRNVPALPWRPALDQAWLAPVLRLAPPAAAGAGDDAVGTDGTRGWAGRAPGGPKVDISRGPLALAAGAAWLAAACLFGHLAVMQLGLTGYYPRPDPGSAALNTVVAVSCATLGLLLLWRSSHLAAVAGVVAFAAGSLGLAVAFAGRSSVGVLPLAVAAAIAAVILSGLLVAWAWRRAAEPGPQPPTEPVAAPGDLGGSDGAAVADAQPPPGGDP